MSVINRDFEYRKPVAETIGDYNIIDGDHILRLKHGENIVGKESRPGYKRFNNIRIEGIDLSASHGLELHVVSFRNDATPGKNDYTIYPSEYFFMFKDDKELTLNSVMFHDWYKNSVYITSDGIEITDLNTP